jgi:DNA modification methylase
MIIAKKLGRHFIGFDLNKDYIKIAERRVSEVK